MLPNVPIQALPQRTNSNVNTTILLQIDGIILMCSPNIHGGYKVTSITSIVGNTTNTVYEAATPVDNGEWGLFQRMNDYRNYPSES